MENLKQIAYTYRGDATGEEALACACIHSDIADKLTKGIDLSVINGSDC